MTRYSPTVTLETHRFVLMVGRDYRLDEDRFRDKVSNAVVDYLTIKRKAPPKVAQSAATLVLASKFSGREEINVVYLTARELAAALSMAEAAT
jgi:hypothetical protein